MAQRHWRARSPTCLFLRSAYGYPLDRGVWQSTIGAMGFNRRKMEDQRCEAAEKEAATRRATDAQVLEDVERLIAAWNERQALHAPMIFSPTIGAAIRAGYWFLWVRCPACQTINAIDLRTLDRHHDAAGWLKNTLKREGFLREDDRHTVVQLAHHFVRPARQDRATQNFLAVHRGFPSLPQTGHHHLRVVCHGDGVGLF
jgi:hypothetical protein